MFVATIGPYTTTISDVTNHEVAHQFALQEVDDDHHDRNHENTDWCLMTYETDRGDTDCEFCGASGADHLVGVRSCADDL